MTEADKLIPTKRVVELCGISRSTIARLEARGLFPPKVKLGHRVRYSLAEVLDWILEMKDTRSVAWADTIEARERRKIEVDKMAADAALARAQVDALAHSPRLKRLYQCTAVA